jgi:hypothetical protein
MKSDRIMRARRARTTPGARGGELVNSKSLNSLDKIPTNHAAHLPVLSKGKHWMRYSIHGNGSCFYNSCAAAFHWDKYLNKDLSDQERIGKKLRESFKEAITDENWNKFWKSKGLADHAPSADQARREIADSKVWANLWTIYAFGHYTRTNFVFYDFGNKTRPGQPYCGVTIHPAEQRKGGGVVLPVGSTLPDNSWRLVLISWTRRSHFDPIFILETSNCENCDPPMHRGDVEEGVHRLTNSFTKKAADEIMSIYNSGQCKNIDIRKVAMQNKVH